MPLVVAFLLLATGFLPWIKDPLQKPFIAWQVPLDLGWQFHTAFINYGLLCTLCALVALYTGIIHIVRRKVGRPDAYFAPRYVTLGLLCMLPFFCLLAQYLFADRYGMSVLAQHMNQDLLIRQHFGYSTPAGLIDLTPFKLTDSTLLGRLILLVDLQVPSVFLPMVCGFLLIGYQRLALVPGWTGQPRRMPTAALLLITLAAFIVFGRAPLATICEYNAKTAIAQGNMGPALQWLQVASVLNPSFEQVTYFHVYRGQAYYTLAPYIVSDDSRIYLAFSYRSISDFLDAQQELLALWHLHPNEPWVINETSYTLELLAEFKQNKATAPVQRTENDTDSVTWLQRLLQVDPTNVYAQYVSGRLAYFLHSYSTSIGQMEKVVGLSNDNDIQSSAYTYVGLSVAGQGDVLGERQFLVKALKLDPNFHNNTAREELSGLH